MVCVISLNLRTDIIGIIPPTLRAQCTQTFRSQQFFCHNIKYLLLLCPIQWRIVKSNSKYHIGTNAPIHHITVYIIKQITVLITKNFHKRFSCYFCLSIQFVCKNVIPTLTHNVRNKTQSIIPQRIHLNNISGARDYRMPVNRRVHPGNCLFLAICVKQTVFMQEKIIMLTLADIIHNIL